jgi:hypothetical protein
MAFLKYGRAMVAKPVTSIETWQNKTASKKEAANSFIDLREFPPDEYIFTQATIMGSVDLEKNGYYIKEGFEPLVNMNGDCWTNKVTSATHGTFRGAYNFLNHIQIPEQSKGTILDSAPRLVKLANGGSSVYVDILVATALKHHDLCQQIKSGSMHSLSLGAIVKYSTCSKCGKLSKTGSDYCSHLLNERRHPFTDEYGKTRIIAEICGSDSDPESNIFIEASWVPDPAFYGAVRRHQLISDTALLPNKNSQILNVQRNSSVSLIESSSVDSNYMARVARIARK